MLELGAYELLWSRPGSSFRKVAEFFREDPDALPSDLVDKAEAMAMAEHVVAHVRKRGVDRFGIRVHRSGEYPAKLRDAKHPVELLYYRGIWDMVEARCVSVVGTRKPTPEGVKRARKLSKMLGEAGFTIVSGLAAGVDTAAHTTALAGGFPTIAVIGTSICEVYPKENASLQEKIAAEHLLVSQVPVERYRRGNPSINKLFFPERNVTMSALTEATVIVEAGETSGTRVQANAAFHQGRKLFILDSCFQRADLTWPEQFRQRGAVRVRDFQQILDELAGVPPAD